MSMKVLFFDIDGTLVGKDKKPSSRIIAAINALKKNGHLIFLCTGRSKNYIGHLNTLGFDGFIANAGACVYYHGQKVFGHYLDQDVVKRIETIFDRYDIAYDHECDDYDYIKEKMISDMFYDPDPVKQKEKIAVFLKENSTLPMEEYRCQPVYKISYTCDDQKQMRKAADELSDIIRIVINPAFSKITGDLLYEGVDKGSAIKALISYLGLDMKDTIGFGDSANDIEMLKACATSIVMGNGDEETKKYADSVCKSVDDDGIYYELLRRHLI